MNIQKELTNIIVNQIIPQNNTFIENNITISIFENHLIIKTQKNEYYLKIRKIKKNYIWLIYNKKNLLYTMDSKNNFNQIINLINEIEKN